MVDQKGNPIPRTYWICPKPGIFPKILKDFVEEIEPCEANEYYKLVLTTGERQVLYDNW
jgi:hypothetical protein